MYLFLRLVIWNSDPMKSKLTSEKYPLVAMELARFFW